METKYCENGHQFVFILSGMRLNFSTDTIPSNNTIPCLCGKVIGFPSENLLNIGQKNNMKKEKEKEVIYDNNLATAIAEIGQAVGEDGNIGLIEFMEILKKNDLHLTLKNENNITQ